MSVELSMLMWSGVLLLALILITANSNIMSMGLGWAMGNRDEAATPPGWGARAKRAYMNHLENLLIFAAILLPVSLSGISNDMTVLGAQIFLVARIAHAVVYVTGITFLGLRTLAYFAGVAGTVMVLLQAI
ncbi:MAG: MAPEG family protein [Parvibaculum sp.]